MRIIIDKDYNERKLLQETYEKQMPTYTVKAINESDKFVYAKGLKNINEVNQALCELINDSNFIGCGYEVCESTNKSSTVMVSESEIQVFTEGLIQFFKNLKRDIADEWNDKGYVTSDNKMTNAGYAAMNAKDTPPEEQKSLTQLWNTIKAEVIKLVSKDNAVKVSNVEVVPNGKRSEPINVNVTGKDSGGQDVNFIMSTKTGEIIPTVGKKKGVIQRFGDWIKGLTGNKKADGNPDNPDNPDKPGSQPAGPGEEAAKSTGNANPGVGGKKDSDNATIKDVKDIVAAKLKEKPTTESTLWQFNDKSNLDKPMVERLAISTFFKTLNESNVASIVYIDQNNKKRVYDVKNGSSAYSEFKKDFRESTGLVKKGNSFKVVVESTKNQIKGLNGYNYSDFDNSDWMNRVDESSHKRVVTFRASESSSKPTKKVDESSKKTNDDGCAKQGEHNNVVNESLTLEFTSSVDSEMKSLLASMSKYSGVEKKVEDTPAPAATPVTTFGQEVVQEADDDPPADDASGGDDAGGGDADPFADAGGDDAGGDAGGDADPFADDAGGGDDAGGDAGGDPFADGGGDAGGGGGGDASAPAPDGGDAPAGDDGAAPADDASGEPAPDDAVNTDAQGNPKSQYNINVTKPFNVNDNFSLNEQEQQEFFGKIDQLCKIPDMENYSLYLYQITPENLNLDDVHYITALYELSVKLGLLDDVYADSNLLDKYSDYKYSVLKTGDDASSSQNKLELQEGSNDNPRWQLMESSDKKKKKNKKKTVSQDNKEKAEALKDDDERRGAKDTKLNKDENGVDKPIIIDTNKEGWDNRNKKLSDSTEMNDFHGLGWVATFKAMQFGSPRFMSMYIKKNGDGKAEDQCRKYLERLSYNDIEFVNIEEIDPYEFVYRQGAAGMKSVEELQTAKFANKDIPYLESSSNIPSDIKRDVKGVITKLNAEIRNTKQFNFLKECGVEKPQIQPKEFLECYKTAQVDETVGDTTYKFVLKKNDSMMSRMFYSNMKEKLFRYLGTFATKYNMECGCEETPTMIMIDFVRSTLNNPMGYDLDTMVDQNTL